jgi:transcriptional regulator with XRE-family HTH domain
MSQAQLSEIVGTKQSVISRLEDPDAGSVNLNTLLKIAEAFDVSLIVKFSSFGKFLNEYQEISPKELAVNSYDEEIECINSNLDTIQNYEVWESNMDLLEQWIKSPVILNESNIVSPQPIEFATTSGCKLYPPTPTDMSNFGCIPVYTN